MIPLHDDNPTERFPFVTIIFIAVCVSVFLYQESLPQNPGQAFVFHYGAIPAIVFGQAAFPEDTAVAIPASLTLLTSMFLHGGWMHLLGNMLYLWIFGNNIEDAMGHVKYVVFYILCGVLAALTHAMTDPSSQIPMVGASGAISAVLGAYLLLFPRAHVLVLLPALGMTRVPAGVVLGMWFVTQLVSGGMSIGAQGGGVAFFAHIGGFVAGMALIGLFKRPDVPFFSPGRSRRWDR
ncbi:MAG: rhomboid family intramembrane serine protease [Nitrospiraceae bacterium]|uniref:rhomboid family intramembrane serine protease n=1 Tax=Nitrospira cf. moscoviensis SBR1015 TaxID=96242 RepID=UPI000A0E7462|nr:rhomboid family intramembrane serine protease [Nitrospira cf. moscoviensis SBR1015]MBY0248919.1 rhomboid family intramembrane serine protease [Nitrospiraceae bacterium]OQW34616.1 MAG: rhomboid family intramembrane serine protease [Nitrospira sp. SG-bin2]